MNAFEKYWVIIAFTLLVSSCTKDDQRGFPSVTTLPDPEVFENGAVVHAEISQENVFEITDHGVVFCIEKNTDNDQKFDKISLGILAGSAFSVNIDRNLVRNETYIVKAYVTTKEKTVYGNEISFLSKGSNAPVITGFLPEKGMPGDTLKISGKHFSSKNADNKVIFSTITAQIISSTDSAITVIIPVLSESVYATIQVQVAGFSGQASKNFELKEPVIDEIIPNKIIPGESFKIRGTGLSTVKGIIRNTPPNDSYNYEIQSTSDTMLQVRSNLEYTSTGIFTLSLQQLDREVITNKKLEVYMPEISDVSPTTVWIGSVIEIKGTNLNKIASIYINEDSTEIISQDDKLIKAKILKPFRDSYVLAKINNARSIYFTDQILKFKTPIITSVSPTVAKYDEIIQITGDYFVPGIATDANGVNTFNYISKTQATSSVPWNLPAGPQSFQLLLGGYPFTYTTLDFVIPQIKIASVTPTEIKKGTEIFIELTDVPKTITKSRVTRCMIDYNHMTVKEVTPNGIKAIVNETFNCPEYPGIYLTIGAQDIDGQQIVHLNQPWKPFNFPTLQIHYNDLLCWVPEENILYALSPLDIESGFVYKYLPSTNKWQQLSDLFRFGNQLFPAKAIYADNALYVFSYNYNEQAWNVHKFGIITKKWTKLKSIPDTSTNPEYGGNLFAFVVNNRIFAGKRDWLYELDATNNQWIQKAKIPTARDIFSPAIMVWNSKVLLGFPTYSTVNTEYSSLFEYDPQNNEWKNLGEHENAFFQNGSGGVYTTPYNNKFYITGRSQLTGFTKLNEFDPASLSFREMVAPTQITNWSFLIYEYDNQLYLGNSREAYYRIPVTDFKDIYK
ncbi:MAG TPA: hypothetical protein DER09_15095 [Prolixibacteraceae bacterium]|nr:hypothetical protein [Prolixibacteraceae bacterium]